MYGALIIDPRDAPGFAVRAAHHVSHEQRLEDEQPEREAPNILDDEVDPHRKTEHGGDRGSDDDASCIARHAVNR